jgi:hypothetical protein
MQTPIFAGLKGVVADPQDVRQRGRARTMRRWGTFGWHSVSHENGQGQTGAEQIMLRKCEGQYGDGDAGLEAGVCVVVG